MEQLGPGARVGRYVLLERVGAGGMGIVYAARDPELERKVALKMLRAPRDRGGHARFVREAQAMARLTHPNVVQVYDVGDHQGRVFIAMEYIDGITLGRWVAKKERSWQEIVRTFVAAGRGVAAAHAHGIIHRDFKPENVLLSLDADGTVTGVRVTDFGLARGADTLDSEPASTSSSSEERPLGQTQLTRDGTVMGTPSYMSPEQHHGRPTDPRADQYAFGVALHEALYGERPFRGRSPAELLAAKMRGRLPPADPNSDIPRAVRAVIVRAVAPEPENRWPSMDATLAPLQRAIAPPRRPLPWALAGIAVVATLGAVLWGRPEPCAVEQIEAVWNDAQREASAAAFAGAGVPYSADAWTRTEAAVDAYATAWAEQYRLACDAQAHRALDRRMRCLGDRLHALETAVGVFTDADADVVRNSVSVALGLPRPERCLDDDQALPIPSDPHLAEQASAVQREIQKSLVYENSGRYALSVAAAERATALAGEVGDERLSVAATVKLGGSLERSGDYHRARELLEKGTLAATSLGLDEIAVGGVTDLVFLVAFQLDDLDEAERWARQGLALVERYGSDASSEAALLNAYGALWDARGEFDKAREHFARARDLFTKAHGPQHPDVATAVHNSGLALTKLGDYVAARTELDQAREMMIASLGPEHPVTGMAHDTLGSALLRLGEFDEADRVTRRGLEIRQLALGADHPDVARSYNNLGAIADARGDADQAVVNYTRAADIFAKLLGEDAVTTAASRINQATALRRQGSADAALELLDASIDRLRPHLPAEHPYFAFAHVAAARCHLQLGQPESALRHADLALQACAQHRLEPAACAMAHFTRARARWPAEGAVAEARQAATALRATGDSKSADLQEIEAWIESEGKIR